MAAAVAMALAMALAAVPRRRRLHIPANEARQAVMTLSDRHWSLFTKGRLAGLAGIAMLALTGCNTIGDVSTAPAVDEVTPTATVENAGDVKYYPSDQPVKLGLEYYKKGAYGTANRYFRDAVEKAPEDAQAWIGLAATYDRLRRFDLADQAYATAIRLTGETVQILNDRGYSYMLRGDLTKARAQFLKAYRLDPTNPIVINNLQLLNSSSRFIQRADFGPH
jgi:Flp pilus assembly protein TadD